MQGFITGKDFARSIVAGADVKLIDSLLNRVDELDARLAGYKVHCWLIFASFELWSY